MMPIKRCTGAGMLLGGMALAVLGVLVMLGDSRLLGGVMSVGGVVLAVLGTRRLGGMPGGSPPRAGGRG